MIENPEALAKRLFPKVSKLQTVDDEELTRLAFRAASLDPHFVALALRYTGKAADDGRPNFEIGMTSVLVLMLAWLSDRVVFSPAHLDILDAIVSRQRS